jgi:AraC family transcriptional activator FtrA
MRKKSARPRVVVVAIQDTPIFELAIPCEVFGVDRRDLTERWYDFELVAAEPGITTSQGLSVPPGRGLDAVAGADTVIVPACASIHTTAPAALLAAIREANDHGARIVSICSGAFVIAQAGLLDGRRATTHWMHADELAAKHPQTEVDPTVLYVHDGVWTSAGSAAALDMCLELVRVDHGTAVANEVARRIVTPPHRSGGQAQYLRPRPTPTGSDLADTLDWARCNLDTVTVTMIAARAGTSTRTLHRAMTRLTGGSPQEWLLRERIHAAQELLETTSLTIEAIATRTGIGSAANLRSHFTRTLGTPPGQYRTTFSSAS